MSNRFRRTSGRWRNGLKWIEAVVSYVVRRLVVACEPPLLVAHVAEPIASYKKAHRIVVAAALLETAVGNRDSKMARKSFNPT